MTNFRNVLKVYGLMRNFSPDDEALLNTLRGLSDADREQLMELLGPAKKPAKKAATKTASKSRRAASLGTQLQQARHASDAVCAFVYNDGKACSEGWPNAIHDKAAGYAGYHEYVPAASTKDDNYQEQAGAVVGGD